MWPRLGACRHGPAPWCARWGAGSPGRWRLSVSVSPPTPAATTGKMAVGRRQSAAGRRDVPTARTRAPRGRARA